MKKSRFLKSRVFGIVVRILFYGLFFAGPCLLTDSHSIYVRSKIECAKIEDIASRKKMEDECRLKVARLDFFGVGCFALWILWLVMLLGKKVSVYVGRKKCLVRDDVKV